MADSSGDNMDELEFIVSWMIDRALFANPWSEPNQAPVGSETRRALLRFYDSPAWRTYQQEVERRRCARLETVDNWLKKHVIVASTVRR